MKSKSIPELDKLFLSIGTYRKSSELKMLFEFIRKFPRIAPYNAMLAYIQKPGSKYIASESEWQNRFDRTIKAGARPLVILRPFGPVSFVYELADTEGEKTFPEKLLNPFKAEGTISGKAFDRLLNNLKCDGICYTEADYGTGTAGVIKVNNKGKVEKIIRRKKEIWVEILYDIIVNRNHPLETKFATIIHELGHLYCGHLGTVNQKWWSDRSYLNKVQKEFEAESVCWLVCERMGINNPTFDYLEGYLNGNKEIPVISIDTILKSVAIIELMINRSKKVRKEIIVNNE